MDRSAVERWVDGYVQAWRSPGTEGLAALFTRDITYLPSPWAQPVVGLDALATFWEAERDGPEEVFTFDSDVIAVDGDTAVVRVAVEYRQGRRWRDLWVLRLSADGRCAAFEEWPFTPGQPDGH
jgi:ketosteroid isomerase-like protein